MAIVNGSLQEGYKDAAWFAANPTLVLLVGQKVNLEQTGTYKLGDGVTQLSALTFLGGNGLSYTPEDVANKSTSVTTDQASNTKYPSVKAVYDWVTSLFVKKGTLTTNYIPKATASDTIGDSSITDDGTTVTVNSPTVITSDNSNNQIISIDNLKALVAHDVKILFNSPIYSFANMQANETVETDASKNLVSVAKGTAFNKNFGTGTTNIPEIGTTLINSQIVETNSSGKLITAAKNTGYNLALGTTAGTVLEGNRITQTITNGVTDKVPSEDAVFDMFKNHRQIYSSIRITQDSATITGTTSETILSSVLIPANTFSVNDVINLEIRCKKASATGATSHRIRLNTSNSLSGATLAGIVTNNNTVLMPTFSRNLVIKSSTNTEVMGTSAIFSMDIGSITSAISSINIDWTIDQYIIISVQPSVSAETNILSYLLIERR